MGDEDSERFSRVSADAVSAAMTVVREEMPEASEARGLLLILGNAAISCGRLRVERTDVLDLVGGAYDQGARLPQEHSLFPHGRIEAYLAECKGVGRSSPAGSAWHDFWTRMSAAKPAGVSDPPVPLILAASSESNASKHRRLREQLEWAERNGLLDVALSWLAAIPAEQWNVSSLDRWHVDSYLRE